MQLLFLVISRRIVLSSCFFIELPVTLCFWPAVINRGYSGAWIGKAFKVDNMVKELKLQWTWGTREEKSLHCTSKVCTLTHTNGWSLVKSWLFTYIFQYEKNSCQMNFQFTPLCSSVQRWCVFLNLNYKRLELKVSQL